MSEVWENLENRLVQLNSLSMSRNAAVARARQTLAEVRSGSIGNIEPVEFAGPKTFLRIVGSNRVYGGEWWFDEAVLQRINQAYSRVFFGVERTQAVRAALREILALAATWNKMAELWALKLPPGEVLLGYQSRARSQSLFSGLPVSPANRMLAGGAMQIFFPVKNPFWIERYGNLV